MGSPPRDDSIPKTMASPMSIEQDGAKHDSLNFDLDRQDAPLYPWATVKASFLCQCFNFVLQLVLIATLGSFMFGLNLALLNTALSSVNADFQTCGLQNRDFEQYWGWTPEACAEEPTCRDNCGILDDHKNVEAVRCPGGFNDLDCDILKWLNAIVSCAILIGGAAGSLTGGYFFKYGRRTIMLIMMVVFAIGVISSVTANSFSALLWARLITGYGVGLATVASPTYMSEVTPPARRGTYGVFHQLGIVIGLFVANLLGLPLMNPSNQDDFWVMPVFQRFWWRFMLGIGILPVILGLYFLLAVYSFETPVYYVEQKRFRDAHALLRLLYNKDNVDQELQTIVDQVREGEISRANGMSFKAALSVPEFRWVIIVGCVISAFQQFGGINVFMTSSNDLFRRAGLSGTMQTVMSIIMSAINVIMTFPTLYLIERMGRKSLLLFGSIGQFIFVLPAAVSYWTESYPENPTQHTQILAIVGILGFVLFFALAYGPILWVYLFEIYPMEIKDVAAAAAAAVNWVSGIVMVFVALVIPSQVPFTLFAVLQLAGTLFIFFFMLETKGRPLGDSPYITRAGPVGGRAQI